MLINYTVCHVLEGENRKDREKEKESGEHQRKKRGESGGLIVKKDWVYSERGEMEWSGVKEQGQEEDLLRDPRKGKT